MLYRNTRTGEEREFTCELTGTIWERVEPAPVSAASVPAKKTATKKAVKQNGDKLRDN